MNKKLKFIIIFGVILVVCVLISGFLLLNKKVTYEVTFDSNGGTAVSSQTVEKNDRVSVPDDPIKSGYVLVDWELNGKSYNFKSPVKENIKLVEFEFNGKKYIMNTDTFGETKTVHYKIEMIQGMNYLKIISTTQSNAVDTSVWKYEYKGQ